MTQLIETKTIVTPSPAKRLARFAPILIACALLGLYMQRLLLPAVGLFHDDGVYLVTAKALATGQGYRIISLPTPVAQTKYPILFPTLLALVWKVFPAFPENVVLLKLVPFLATLAWFALAYRYFVGEGLAQHPAMVLTLVLAITPWVLYLSSILLSEALFFAFSMAAVVVIRRVESSATYSRFLPFAAGALAGAATLTRIAGVTLIAAGALALVRKSRKAAAIFLATAVALYLPWLAWTSHDATAPSSVAYYTAGNYSSSNALFNFTLDQKLEIVGTNLAATIGSCGLLFEYRQAGIALLIAAVLSAGFMLDIRQKGFTVVHTFCLSYLGLITVWTGRPLRFVVLLTPILLLFVFRVTTACAEKMKLPWLPAAALLLAVPMLLQDAYQTVQSRKAGAVLGPGTSNEPPAKWYEYAQIASWIRDNAPPSAVIAANLDPFFYLYTGHPSVREFSADPYLLFYAPSRIVDALGSVGDFVRGLKQQNATVLVCTSESGFAERKALKKLTTEAVSLYPEAFHLALQLPDPEYRVYFVDPSRLPFVPDLP